ncbi:TPA: restriction endonuclease subunit S [Streptococcus agalactiae]|nr:restriction endonuclease subunit S [Streptococcus agalactiae]
MTKQKQPQYRFDGFDGEWEEKKLGELSNIVRGASPRPIQDPKWFDTESDVGWLRISDVTEQEGRITYLQQRISKLGQEKTRVLKDSHLLLSIAATVGKPVINYVKTGIHDGFLVFLDPKFSREFMFQWLDMFRPYWNKYGQPGSQVNLNSEIVRNQVINLPSLPEQESIGQLFQTVDQLLQLQDQKLATLKAQKQTFLRKMFPAQGQKVPEIRLQGFDGEWEEKKLGEAVTFLNGRAYKQNELLKSGKYKVVRVGNFNTNETCYYSNLELDQDKYANNGDLLYLWATNFGPKFWYGEKIIYHYHIWKLNIKNNKSLDKNFLFTWLYFDKEKIKQNTNGTTMVHVTKSMIEERLFLFPSLSEQEAIGDFFQTLDQQMSQTEEKLTELKALKQTLLNRLFV